jgi:hypothetical protein
MRPPDIIQLNSKQTDALIAACSLIQAVPLGHMTIRSDRKDGAVDVVYAMRTFRLHKDDSFPEVIRR